MKYQNYLFLSVVLLFSGSMFASQVSDTMRAQYAEGPAIKPGSQLATQKNGSQLAAQPTEVISGKELTVETGIVNIPTELQKLVTPALKQDSQLTNFIVKHEQLWKEKKALIEKDPQLKELAKKHIELKKEMLKLKEQSPEHKKFFEEAFKYWINKMDAELK